jgi:ABC-type transporter Mla subunit MlaD
VRPRPAPQAPHEKPRLTRDLHELYGTDEEIIERINEMLKASDKALSAVNEALRAGDGSSVHNVDKAAAILREQAEAIRPVEDQLKQLRDELSDQIAKLR